MFLLPLVIFVYYLWSLSIIFFIILFHISMCIIASREIGIGVNEGCRLIDNRIRDGRIVTDQKITDVGYNGLARGARFHDWTRRLLVVQKINIFRVRFLFRGAMIEITLSRLCFPSFSWYVTAAPHLAAVDAYFWSSGDGAADAGRNTRLGLASALTIVVVFKIVINRGFVLIKTSGTRGNIMYRT